ncbi:tryptophan synthase subunit beta like protein [Dechloromonas sp. HYN0024]|uniref:tryptophan synthase subunit beta like protein n=1 Tax=Dechloromonas sp. HYN0024 TaxID=2231055 RepID=UPI000E446D64|nr:tryptophan synthase subunit beta like protein [Dechloromonas sp. HYN0024]AXS79344.1 tryptophan synthase subunit beta like protein [Dechloromonas sp. HYN0024]
MPLGEAREAMSADNPEVLQFIHERWRQNELDVLDRDFVRVIEDTIELLIAKDLILFTDLPPKVQDKLMRRKEVRQLKQFEGNFGAGGDDIIPL